MTDAQRTTDQRSVWRRLLCFVGLHVEVESPQMADWVTKSYGVWAEIRCSHCGLWLRSKYKW